MSLLLAVLLLVADTNLVHETNVRYASSIDPIDNLYMDLCYPAEGTDLPILVLMHGHGGDKNTITQEWKERVAGHGLFVVAVDMRGRSISGGTKDLGGREIYDIHDAIVYVKEHYADRVDPSSVSLAGYSGGGGNALSVATKFPDLCGYLVAYFGISDYGFDSLDGWWWTTPSYRPSIEVEIGGTPMSVPDRYRARMSVYGVRNNPKSWIRLYHDAQDGTVPVVNSDNWVEEADRLGYENSILSRSGPGDALRWIHGYPLPGGGEPLIASESEWIPEILSGLYKDASPDEAGSWIVLGYVKTERFRVFLGDGTGDVATLDYDIDQDPEVFWLSNDDTANDLTAHFEIYGLLDGVSYAVAIRNLSTSQSDALYPVADADGTVAFSCDVGAYETIRVVLSTDWDGDQVADYLDNCPDTWNADQTDSDEDGFGDECDCAPTWPRTYPGAPEVNDGVDNQCPGDHGHGVVDEISGISGFRNPGDRNEFSWSAQAGASDYEVARSSLPDLSDDCTTIARTETYWSDSEDPGQGICFHYLVRPLAPHPGSWGHDSSGVERTNVCP